MKKPDKIIFIPIETISREIDYKIYLSMLLSLQGFKVVIGKKYCINKQLKDHINYLYIDKGFHAGVSNFLYKIIRKNKGIIINLDEEGAVDFPNNSTLINRYSNEMLKSVDRVFFWGKAQKEMIEKKLGKNIKSIVTGHPRFLLLKNRFFGIYNDKIAAIKENHGKFILINTNFGFGNNVNGDDFVKLNYGQRFKNINKIIKEDKLKYNSIICLINKISKKNNIIIRPHPEENINTYLNEFKNNNSVKTIREYSSIPWIIASELLIHIDCTTGIEAIILNKRVLSFVPNSLDTNYLTKLPISISEVRHKLDDFESLDSISTKDSKTQNNILVDYFNINSNIYDFVDQIFKVGKDISTIKTSNFFGDLIWKYKLKLIRIKLFFQNNKLQKSKLKQYSNQSFKSKFNFYKNSDSIFKNCKMIEKNELFYFTKVL